MSHASGSSRAQPFRRNARPRSAAVVGRRLSVFAYFLLMLISATMLVAQQTVHQDTGSVFGRAATHISLTFPFIIHAEPQDGDTTAFDQELEMTRQQLLDRWNPLVEAASKRFGVPVAWIRAVIARESGGRTMSSATQPITSSAGALGLMQLMPDTYEDMREAYRLGADPFNPKDNIIAGTAYLRQLHARYGFPAMFAAYNDGPGNYEKRLKTRTPLPAETRAYIKSIAGKLGYRVAEITFTTPNGKPVSIAGAAVTDVRAPLRHEFARSVHAVIRMGKLNQGVRESVAEVKAALSPSGLRLAEAR